MKLFHIDDEATYLGSVKDLFTTNADPIYLEMLKAIGSDTESFARHEVVSLQALPDTTIDEVMDRIQIEEGTSYFDLFVSDYRMHQFNGLELVAAIRECSELPIVIMSADRPEWIQEQIEANELGDVFAVSKFASKKFSEVFSNKRYDAPARQEIVTTLRQYQLEQQSLLVE